MNARGSRGATPLHCAVSTADRDMLKLFIFWDIDSTSRDIDWMLAIDLAKKRKRMDMVAGISPGRWGLPRVSGEPFERVKNTGHGLNQRERRLLLAIVETSKSS